MKLSKLDKSDYQGMHKGVTFRIYGSRIGKDRNGHKQINRQVSDWCWSVKLPSGRIVYDAGCGSRAQAVNVCIRVIDRSVARKASREELASE